MNTLTFTFTLGSILAGAFYLWTFTKSGKKWLKNL